MAHVPADINDGAVRQTVEDRLNLRAVLAGLHLRCGQRPLRVVGVLDNGDVRVVNGNPATATAGKPLEGMRL